MAATIAYAFAREHKLVALGEEGASVRVAITHDTPIEAIAEARRVLGKPLVTERVAAEQFSRLLAEHYGANGSTQNASIPAAQIGANTTKSAPQVSDDLLSAKGDDGPAVQAVNQLLIAALNAQASDIHLEPYEKNCTARFRIDGQLRDVPRPLGELTEHFAAIVARLKVMARLDLAERRLPQDGRISVQIAGRAVDVRLSTLPCAFGERVVLRLLDQSSARLDLTSLGLPADVHATLKGLLSAPNGIVLVTGPTGSGKTTTLYGALAEIAQRTRNIMTVEDPIEYAIPGIAQTAVNPGIGLTFARALRAMLRQDPDVMLVGEIRDAETAQIAVQASLTGHLVLATLHTNDAAGAVTRLVEMGVEPYLLASSLRGVIAQRLVRTLCKFCKKEEETAPQVLARLQAIGSEHIGSTYRAMGCPKCEGVGYRGRTGVYECLVVDGKVRAEIHAGANHAALTSAAHAQGMRTLERDGLRWLASGDTSIEEVLRVGHSVE
jgi:general secretion pathway protein E